MRFTVSPDIAGKYPELRIAIVEGIGVSPKADMENNIRQLKRNSEDELRRSGWQTNTLIQHPFIAAWRETYQSFGIKAKRHKPTAESMIRRVLNGDSIPEINVPVDVYLTVELDTFLPIGGYDLDKIAGDITLRFSPGEERFTLLSGGEEYTVPGEVVYSDAERVLTRRWNYRDCDFAKIEDRSSNIILMIEAASGQIPTPALQEATEMLSERLIQFLDGDVSNSVIHVASCISVDISEVT